MGQECNKACVNYDEKEVFPIPLDQKLTHHVVIFRTNPVYIDRKSIELELIVDQVAKAFERDNPQIYFNA